MKSRVFTISSLLAMVVAMAAATSAFAQSSSPAQDVYNPNNEVLGTVEGGGSAPPVAPGGSAPPVVTVPDTGGVKNNTDTGGGKNIPDTGGLKDNTDKNEPVLQAERGADTPTTPATAPAVSSGDLPFTGFQAGLVALAGLALLATGVAMRRVARTDTA